MILQGQIKSAGEVFKYRHTLDDRIESYITFLKALSIEFTLDTKNFSLATGKIVPVFVMPTFNYTGSLAIVSSTKFTRQEKKICKSLCKETKKSVIMFEGRPACKVYEYFEWNRYSNTVNWAEGIPNADEAEGEDRMYASPGSLRGCGYGDWKCNKYKEDVTIENCNYGCMFRDKYYKAVGSVWDDEDESMFYDFDPDEEY